MKKFMEKNNEITVKVNCTAQELRKVLLEKNCKIINKYDLEDMYFLPAELNYEKLYARESLKNAIMIRDYNGHMPECREYEFTRKSKEFNENGEIINQCQINCPITNIEAGKSFLESIGYKCFMSIREYGQVFEKDGLKIIVKDVKNGNLLIELEENEQYDTIEKLKEKLHEFELPIDENDYFVKKAEIEFMKRIK